MTASQFPSSLLRHAPERAEFAPPVQPGRLRAVGLALLAHSLLLLALTWGVNWTRQPADQAVEAELWSAIPQQAAPKPPEEPSPPQPEQPPRQAQPQPRPTPPDTRDADIALARKKREAERKAEEKLALQKKAEEDKKRQAREQAQEEERRKEAAKAKEDARKEAAKAKDDARKQAALKAQQAKEAEAIRQQNIRRAMDQAMASIGGGGATSTGTAAKSAGPSAGYGNRIRARIKPNIVYTDNLAGNPTTEVEVRVAPDGTIISRRVVKSSGVKDWDDAVIKAIDKTEILPKDTDGRVPPELLISFRPKD